MHDGSVAEIGDPQDLLKNKEGRFASLARQSKVNFEYVKPVHAVLF